MAEVFFYHLTYSSLEQALPMLLQKCLERQWPVVVQTKNEQRCEELDAHLWTFSDESFLPHASQSSSTMDPADHPVWLTTTTENPNDAKVRFLTDGAVPGSIEEYERVMYMFDGRDEDAVAAARERWKLEKEAGHDLAYWQQDEQGKWTKKA